MKGSADDSCDASDNASVASSLVCITFSNLGCLQVLVALSYWLCENF